MQAAECACRKLLGSPTPLRRPIFCAAGLLAVRKGGINALLRVATDLAEVYRGGYFVKELQTIMPSRMEHVLAHGRNAFPFQQSTPSLSLFKNSGCCW
jgi:hypothetical protein